MRGFLSRRVVLWPLLRPTAMPVRSTAMVRCWSLLQKVGVIVVVEDYFRRAGVVCAVGRVDFGGVRARSFVVRL